MTDPTETHSHTITVHGQQCVSKYGLYSPDRLAIQYICPDGERMGVLTVNIPKADLEDGEFAIKDWSENESLSVQAFKSGLFIDTGKTIPTGFTEAPVWKFTNPPQATQ